MMFKLGGPIERAAREHAMDEYPQEAVGAVVEGAHGRVYMPLQNVSDDPTHKFEIGARPLLPMLAIIHSHTMDQSVAPSRVDMESQQATHIPWGIIRCDGLNTSPISWFGDQVPVAPLLGRQFVSGHHDCWGLVRDVYRTQFGIVLPNFPRDENWYKDAAPHGKALDLFSVEHIIGMGATVIAQSEAREGDVVLGKIGRTGVVNHCGLLLGNGLVLHQLEGRLSRREPVGPWMRYIRYVVRHNKFMDSRELPPRVEIRS